MTIEVTGPDGSRVSFPDGTDAGTINSVMSQHFGGGGSARPQTWGEYGTGLGRQALQGLTFSLADEAEALLPFMRQSGEDYRTALARIRRGNDQFSSANPIASVAANVVGSVPTLALGPGGAAARWAMAARTLPTGAVVAGPLGTQMARSAVLGTGAGALSGFGAGEGGPGESGSLAGRIPNAVIGAALGAGLGAAAPPVIAGIGRIASTVAPAASSLMRRRPSEPQLPFNAYSHPIEGARFVADGVAPPVPPMPAEVASGQERAILALRDAMLRAGRTPQEYQAMLDDARAAAKPHSSGQAQTVTTLADLDEGMTRQAGVFARQSPEAAREMVQVMSARQTGITPMGADAAALAQRGIPSAPRLAEPITGRQAQTRFGTHFGAGQDNQVPMGSRDRIRDWLERFYLIKDKKHHGFGRTGIETMEQAATRADELSAANYAAARTAHAAADFRQPIDNVFSAAMRDATVKEAPMAEGAIRAAHQMFRPGQRINLEQFDNTKRVLDNRISALFAKPATVHIGGLLNDVKNRLIAAVDDATGGVNSLYRKARVDHTDQMENMRAYLAGRHVYTEDQALRRTGPLAELISDENAAIRYFQRLGQDARPTGNGKETFGELRQKLWRQGHTDALEARLPRNVGRSGLQMFNEERVERLLRDTAPAETSSRAAQLGRYIDFEGRMPETKQKAVGGSDTAMRVQDDLMAIATEASQNVQGVMEVLRGNQSLYQLGERLVTAAWSRAFGVGADAAREGTRMLFTANPAEQAEILRRVAAVMPANRMARFNELMEHVQRSLVAPSASTVAGSLPPSGPVSI